MMLHLIDTLVVKKYLFILISAARPVIVGYDSQFVQQGQRASVRCIVSGNPTPTVYWHLDGQPLLDRNSLTVGDFRSPSGDVVSYVNISRVTLREGGDYVCTATNKAGSSEHTSRLNVYGIIIHLQKIISCSYLMMLIWYKKS